MDREGWRWPRMVIESAPGLADCSTCGVVAFSHGGRSAWCPAGSARPAVTGLASAAISFVRVKEATRDTFDGYQNAIGDKLEDGVAVFADFHVVKLSTAAVDEVGPRVQQQIHGHRGRKDDRPYEIRTILCRAIKNVPDRQRLGKAMIADPCHDEG